MKPQTFLLAALAGLASSASIPWPGAVRDFFAAVSDDLRDWKQNGGNHEPACDFSQNARMPASGLPPPSTGLVLYHVAVGRGTQVSLFFPFLLSFPPLDRESRGLRQICKLQNYTCGSDSSQPPVQTGATATLFNASCLSIARPKLLSLVTPAVLSFPTPPSTSQQIFPANLLLSGHHYFSDPKTPVFNLHTPNHNYGIWFGKKIANVTGPDTAVTSTGPNGEAAVPWLKLQVLDVGAQGSDVQQVDTEAGVKEVYRVNTHGGSAPATCAGKHEGEFEIEYAAEYWFYGSAPGPASGPAPATVPATTTSQGY